MAQKSLRASHRGVNAIRCPSSLEMTSCFYFSEPLFHFLLREHSHHADRGPEEEPKGPSLLTTKAEIPANGQPQAASQKKPLKVPPLE